MITKVSPVKINNYNRKNSNKVQYHSASSKNISFTGLSGVAIGVAIAGGVLVAKKLISKNGKKIAHVVKHVPEIISKTAHVVKHAPEIISKTATKISEDIKFKGVETIINEAGQRVPKAGFRSAAVVRADEVPGIAKLWPEIESLSDKIDAKFLNNKHFDLDYYKDSFRLNFTVPAEKLKYLREVKEPEKFSDVFKDCKIYFQTQDGLMIYGKNEVEKEKLLNHFVDEAKSHGMDIEYISTKGVTSDEQIGEPLVKAFENAKKKFNEQKKHTLLVIENVDTILKKDGSGTRAIWNEQALASGQNGVITLTTAKDINTLDESCVRNGRISYKINIDDALAKQAQTDKTKIK